MGSPPPPESAQQGPCGGPGGGLDAGPAPRDARVMRWARLIGIVVLAALLGACSNLVVSDRPWFDAATSAARPGLRDGLWRTDDPDCKVREAAPVEQWPDCAQWLYRRGQEALSLQWSAAGKGRQRVRTWAGWSRNEQLLVAGDPLILQDSDCPRPPDKAAEPAAGADGGADRALAPAGSTAAELSPRFCYAGVRAIATDSGGRITAIEVWTVVCGPLPSNEAKVTDRPWPGLTVAGDNCTAASAVAVRDAAQRSREMAERSGTIVRSRWVREGYR